MKEQLKFVQAFGAEARYNATGCDIEGCIGRAFALWQDSEHKAYALCGTHRREFGAEEIPEGIEYAPTNLLLDSYMWVDGKPMKKPTKIGMQARAKA